MKRVVSVSLGSSTRDHTVEVDFLGQRMQVGREGTDGDFGRALARLQELDGKVDAIGLGGIDVYLRVGAKRYVIGDGLKLMQAVHQTPVADGSGIKNTVEREAVLCLAAQPKLLQPSSRVLLVSALDRFGMAEAFVQLGCPCVFGDLIFAMRMDYPITTLAELEKVAERYRTRMEKLPFHYFYPVGEKQDQAPEEKFGRYYEEANVIAGDFHFIKRYMPPSLAGKLVVTNTTTSQDVELLKARGVAHLATTTPVLEGRSFGTNVLEAMFLAVLGKRQEAVAREEYEQLTASLDLKPVIRQLN